MMKGMSRSLKKRKQEVEAKLQEERQRQKKSRRCFPSGSGSTGGRCTGVAKELAEESKSGTVGISSV